MRMQKKEEMVRAEDAEQRSHETMNSWYRNRVQEQTAQAIFSGQDMKTAQFL